MLSDTPSGCGSDQPMQIKSDGVDHFSHLPILQRTIINFIVEQPQSNVGIDVAIIAQSISGNGVHNAQEIRYEHNFIL